jgi:hypothetical protein
LPEEAQLQIRDWYVGRPLQGVPRMTLDEISSELRKLGYNVRRGQIWRWLARQRDDLNSLRDMAARAEALVRYLVPKGATVETSVLNLFQAFFLKALNTAEITEAPSIEDLARLAEAVGRLQTSAAARDKREQEKDKKISEAVESLKCQVRKELEEKDPDLLRRLMDFVDQAAETMMEAA